MDKIFVLSAGRWPAPWPSTNGSPRARGRPLPACWPLARELITTRQLFSRTAYRVEPRRTAAPVARPHRRRRVKLFA